MLNVLQHLFPCMAVRRLFSPHQVDEVPPWILTTWLSPLVPLLLLFTLQVTSRHRAVGMSRRALNVFSVTNNLERLRKFLYCLH